MITLKGPFIAYKHAAKHTTKNKPAKLTPLFHLESHSFVAVVDLIYHDRFHNKMKDVI